MKKLFLFLYVIFMFSISGIIYDIITPTITGLSYNNITHNEVTVYWNTDIPSDSKILWFKTDSNYQPVIFTDSSYNSEMVITHNITINNLEPAVIYKFKVCSQSTGGTATDSGYLITRSLSSGRTDVYFNHTVDTSVCTGEKAKGNQNFETLLINRIDSAAHSMDITLWEFSYYNTITTALINAKARGVKIRFIADYYADSPQIDTLISNGIPVLKRSDSLYSMHNKFIIFDYRYNTNLNTQYLWTGSTNVSHPQFHSDKNNIITVQDESLCAAYTREFEEMWGSHTDFPDVTRAKFGTTKTNNVPHIFNVAGTRMELYFGPSDSSYFHIDSSISAFTTKSIFFCILKYNLFPVEETMHNKFNNGSQIKGVFDLSHANMHGSSYPRMRGLQVNNAWSPPADVYIDSSTGLVHHKYLITDANSQTGNKLTVTGSFNWDSATVKGNDENTLIIFDSRLNNLYYQEFYARYRGAGGEVIGIKKESSIIPVNTFLEQNYPNPFNSDTKIKYFLSKRTYVYLTIYDILGRKVETLINENQSPGIYSLIWYGNKYSSGIYFIELKTPDYSQLIKTILLK